MGQVPFILGTRNTAANTEEKHSSSVLEFLFWKEKGQAGNKQKHTTMYTVSVRKLGGVGAEPPFSWAFHWHLAYTIVELG